MLNVHTQFDFVSRMKSKSQSEARKVFDDFLHARDVVCFDRCMTVGLDINTKDPSWLACDYTALHYLAGGQQKKVKDTDTEDTDTEDTDTDLAAVMYLLTSEPKMNINAKNATGRTAMSLAAWYNRVDFLKLLIDFNADREIVDNVNQSPLYWAKNANCKEAEEILTGYFPKEDDKLHSQMEAKLKVDNIFCKNALGKRFGNKLVDLKYSSIQAIYTGNFDLLKKSIKLIDNAMLLSLTTLAAKEGQVHILGYLCEKYRGISSKIRGRKGEIQKVTDSQFKSSYRFFDGFDGDGEEKESLFGDGEEKESLFDPSSSSVILGKINATNVLNFRDENGCSILDLLDEVKSGQSAVDLIETFLLCGMDPISHHQSALSACLPSSSSSSSSSSTISTITTITTITTKLSRAAALKRIVNRSRVLALFKIIYHKYIYLDVMSIFDLVQTLIIEFE